LNFHHISTVHNEGICSWICPQQGMGNWLLAWGVWCWIQKQTPWGITGHSNIRVQERFPESRCVELHSCWV